MWGAYRERRAADRLLTAFALVTASLPPFLLALLLQKWLVIDLRLFPLSGISTAGAAFSLSDRIRHLALPCLTLALLESGRLSRYIRASAVAALREDAVLAARASGLSPARIFFSFILRGTLIPLITYFGLSLPVLFGGAIVIETLFGLPGLGRLSYEALMARDYPLLLGITPLVCVMTRPLRPPYGAFPIGLYPSRLPAGPAALAL
jgi:peptide/nickel transport system permease protein